MLPEDETAGGREFAETFDYSRDGCTRNSAPYRLTQPACKRVLVSVEPGDRRSPSAHPKATEKSLNIRG